MLLYGCCTVTLTVDKVRVRAYARWFRNGTEVSAITGFTNVVSFWVLSVVAFCSASAGNDIYSTGDTVRGNEGRGIVLVVKSTGSTIATTLATAVFPVPDSAASSGFTVELVMDISYASTVGVSNIVALKGSTTVMIFLVRTFLVDVTTIFCA